MKRTKALLSIALSVIMLFSVCVPCFAINSEKSEKASADVYEKLVSGGFPKEHIAKLSESSLEKIADCIGDYTVTNITCTVSENAETNNRKNSNIKTDVIIIELRDIENDFYIGYTVCVFWEALNKPFFNQNDTVSVTWNTGKFLPETESFYAEDLRFNAADEKWSVYKTYDDFLPNSYTGVYKYGYKTNLSNPEDGVGGIIVFKILTELYGEPTSITETNIKVNYDYNYFSLKAVFSALAVLLVTVTAAIVLKKKKEKKKPKT